MHASSWRNPLTAEVWRSSFRRLVSPTIGSQPIGAFTSADTLFVLTPIWNDGGARRQDGCGIGSAR